ncbi:hypothetical protein BJ138DRAFT_410842 [Hygrophoropsis aurantiaca]|uniref:Uncharacterized protein n=1 Tax=Hygrophoropsis aurantiaca TaxID=72124 RepID=A0ACB8A3R7_9AGAM|nr:hypothetical protein BJ138DRAFT_410842 [Hygrophoropsis aurantiaca]
MHQSLIISAWYYFASSLAHSFLFATLAAHSSQVLENLPAMPIMMRSYSPQFSGTSLSRNESLNDGYYYQSPCLSTTSTAYGHPNMIDHDS